ncbi:AMP-binding protein [Rodentibacter heidelbergensis]|uniref:AMP-binding protein n=1 Tax=Rodentibacter heidelbergensis TaxID=1908258 RepID=A0A1V3I9G2_9PAST|nr:AMP-binding protein [Rodentibacter heidelbergensis]OOF36753.1 AMP-binding protein [Rodentibacter heidelbergensis]
MFAYLPSDLVAHQPAWTYADFEQRAFQISAELRHRQFHSIAVWMEDGAKLACLLLAAWHANVRVLFPPNFTEESIQWVNHHAQCWITDCDIDLENAFQFDEFASSPTQKTAQNRPLFELNNQTEIWLKTSGSTGEPKTIVKTAQQMWLGAHVLAQALPFTNGNAITAISTVSIQHIYGLTVHIMMSLVKGWQIGRIQQFYPECILSQSKQCQSAVVVSSPSMLASMEWQQAKLPQTMCGMISSGGMLAEDLSQTIRQYIPLVEIYGSTETGPIAVREDIGLWQPLPESRIGTNEQGELWIEGSWLSQREQTADVVQFEERGFRLLGRSDRIVKVGDKRISLVSVENTLTQHPWVNDCYIAKHPEKKRLASWVALNQEGITFLREKGHRALIQVLKSTLKYAQEEAAIPRFWRFTDSLPRNTQSKINKLEFNRTFLEDCKTPLWLEEKSEEERFQALGKVPLDLVYLKDHFAEFPLVPGVVELQWIFEKMTTLIPAPFYCSHIDKLKFQKFLRPADQFVLTLKWDEAKGKVTFRLTTDNDVCCSGVAVIAC